MIMTSNGIENEVCSLRRQWSWVMYREVLQIRWHIQKKGYGVVFVFMPLQEKKEDSLTFACDCGYHSL